MSDEVTTTIDVREIPPPLSHSTIFNTFDSLSPGQSFMIVADHNPVPLRMQFQVRFREQFSWAYAEEGPEVWRVKIGRTA